MFYVKQNISSTGCAVEIKVDIDNENVFTVCPDCGKEHKVDLGDIMKCEDADLYTTGVYCFECSAKRTLAESTNG